jgi:hypothetical protein
MIVRGALAIFAALALAWMVVLLNDAHDLARGTAVPGGKTSNLLPILRTPATFKARIDTVNAAKLLNPASDPDIALAGDYALRTHPGDLDRALGMMQAVVRREPQNLQAWVDLLGIQELRHDQAGARVAALHIHLLDPKDTRGS